MPFHCIAHPFCASFFCVISARTSGTWKVFYESWAVQRNKWSSFSPQRTGWTPLFYSIYSRKVRFYTTYPNLNNFFFHFSIFNKRSSLDFQIFRLIHYYNLVFGVSLEAFRHSICLLFHYVHFYGNFKAFYRNTVLLSQDYCLNFVATNYFVKVMGVSDKANVFFILLSKASKLPTIYTTTW